MMSAPRCVHPELDQGTVRRHQSEPLGFIRFHSLILIVLHWPDPSKSVRFVEFGHWKGMLLSIQPLIMYSDACGNLETSIGFCNLGIISVLTRVYS